MKTTGKYRALFFSFLILILALTYSESSKARFAVRDIQSMQLRPDGKYNVICKDGRFEVHTAEEIATEEVCITPVASPTPCPTASPTPTPTATPTPWPTPAPPAKVDILFQIDDSGSMGYHQTRLATAARNFIAHLDSFHTLDYHIGVITTDMDAPTRQGRLFSTLPTLYITPGLPFPEQLLPTFFGPGTSGSGVEQHLAAMVKALVDPAVLAHNAGFYRSNAHLAMIFITDAELEQDNPLVDPLAFEAFIKGSLKSGNPPPKILTYAALSLPGDANCENDIGDPIEFLALVRSLNGKTYNLCDPDWGNKLGDIADDIHRETLR